MESNKASRLPENNSRELNKTKSENSLRSIAKAIPSHLAPLIPGLEKTALQANKTKRMMINEVTNDDTTPIYNPIPPRSSNLEPHYDIEHFIPGKKDNYREPLTNPLRSHAPHNFAVRPERRIDIQPRRVPDTAWLMHTYSHGAPMPVRRQRELIPDPTNPDVIIADNDTPLRVSELPAQTFTRIAELEAPRSAVRVPRIHITPSSPIETAFKLDISDNTLLAPPPICFKRGERRRQAEAERDRLVKLVRARRVRSFGGVEAPRRIQLNVSSTRSPRGASNIGAPSRRIQHASQPAIPPGRGVSVLGNANVRRRPRRSVGPIMVPFERYAYSLFG